ncbi:hypothetical protein GALL_13230 [mine drainage metagenome]|uniref:Uncharacterized protein n=1 Tax=mine drainage metagenome TaxID=410659 RepID=A0A1J5TFV1_9ZZZZ
MTSTRASGRLRSALNTIGTLGAYFAVMIAVALVGLLILKGSVWLSQYLTPWLFKISWCGLVVVLLGLLPLVASKETRGAGGLGIFFASYLFGATLWFWSMLITYTFWGWPALIIGLVIMGVGVLPIALLATAIKGEWGLFGQLLLIFVVTIGTRGGGTWAVHKHEEAPGDLDMPKKLVVTSWLLFSTGFLGVIGYFTGLPIIGCSIALLFSRHRKVRKHGLVLLGLIVGLFAVFFGIGYLRAGTSYNHP